MTIADRDLFYVDAYGRRRLLCRKGQPVPDGYTIATDAPAQGKARKSAEDKAKKAPATKAAPVAEPEETSEPTPESDA